MNTLSLVWWHLRRKTKLLRAWINQDAIAYLNLYCSDFTITSNDWPRSYGIGPVNPDGFPTHYGSRAAYTVVATHFWYSGRGRGYTAWQAAVRAVRHMDQRGRNFRKAHAPTYDQIEELLSTGDFG